MRKTNLLITMLIVLYSFVFKTFPISEGFWWLGDQIRDWQLVQGSFFSLPGHGTPRVDGYYSFGPAFYYTLWFIRAILGPFFHGLPHAGGYGISLLNALSDGTLVLALLSMGFRRLWVLSFALILISSPFESALAGKIWNPPVALAYIQFAISACLFARESFSSRRLIVVTILALFAVQSHTPVIFLAFCVVCFAVFQHRKTQETSWSRIATLLGLTTFFVELPYLIHVWSHGSKSGATGPSEISSTIGNLLHFSSLHLEKSYGVIKAVHNTYLPEGSTPVFIAVCLLFFVFLAKKIRYPIHFIFFGLAPLLLTSSAVSLSTRILEQYFFISLGASLLLIALFLCEAFSESVKARWSVLASASVFILALSLQPKRWELRSTNHVLPEYGLMVHACKELQTRFPVLSSIEGPSMSKPSCAQCLFEFLGGKIDPTSKLSAKIETDGSTTILEN